LLLLHNMLLPTLHLHHALAHAFILDPTYVPPPIPLTYIMHCRTYLPLVDLVTSCCNNQQWFVVVNLSCYCLLIDIMLATMKCFIPHF
jgi:hypothetical protein